MSLLIIVLLLLLVFVVWLAWARNDQPPTTPGPDAGASATTDGAATSSHTPDADVGETRPGRRLPLSVAAPLDP